MLREIYLRVVLWRIRFLPAYYLRITFIKYALVYVNFVRIFIFQIILKHNDLIFLRPFQFTFLARRRYRRLYQYFYVRHLPRFIEVSYKAIAAVIITSPNYIDVIAPFTLGRISLDYVIFRYFNNNPYLFSW